jgi:peptide chain release factor 2
LKEVAELDAVAGVADFWIDNEKAQKVLQKRSVAQRTVKLWEDLHKECEDIGAMIALSEEAGDDSMLAEIGASSVALEKRLTQAELKAMLSGEHDSKNAIMAINSGAGGTESQDWAQVLLRMYTRWGERRGFKTELLDIQYGEEAGIKSATLTFAGEYAYGYLRSEIGVHRLVRISPYDANKRRHTSFASVFVYPEIEDDIEVAINEADLRIDVYRSSGPGGQGVNTTDSAVRITHMPSGIVVACQNERSQHKNKASAMKVLKARLYEMEQEKQNEEIKALEKTKKKIEWGSQIRSYVLHPYRLVKDLRTGFETGNVDPVLDGDLDEFMDAYLVSQKTAETQSA